MKLYLFDMGSKIYGDCLLAVENDRTILIDGAHPGDWKSSGATPSIPEQLGKVLGSPPFNIDLLVVTHCHSDHIGCLPKLVEDETVTFKRALVADESLGFPTDGEDAAMDATTAKVVAAIVEEPQPHLQGAALDEFLADAVKLPDAYAKMLAKLEDDGTKIVRYRGPGAKTRQLEKEFEDFGLKIIGPTAEHLKICRDALMGVKRAARRATDSLRRKDAAVDAGTIYRTLLEGSDRGADAAADELAEFLDRAGRGAALNDQSIVLALGSQAERCLLTGDMQLAVPEVAGLDVPMHQLLEAIEAGGPYRFAKLPHHASYNGFDEIVLDALKATEAFGISTGRGDPNHPDGDVLKLLKQVSDRYHWARTDLNGRIQISFSDAGIAIGADRGQLNDAAPNSADVVPEENPEGAAPAAPPQLPQLAPQRPLPPGAGAGAAGEPPPGGVEKLIRRSTSDIVEVIARIPHAKTKVTITIEVDPAVVEAAPPRVEPRDTPAPQLRQLPSLLMVTHSERLAFNIGKSEAADILAALKGQQVIVDLARERSAYEAIRREARNASFAGVVIIGGYDVVPSERYDTLPPSLRTSIGASAQNDPDNFIVWSDQGYGDLDGDGLADVPVSRIPDGRTARLVQTALRSSPPTPTADRFGLRNFARPFADGIYSALAGQEAMLTSQAISSADVAAQRLSARLIYLMLHGSDTDGSCFWGETQGGMLEAMTVKNVPEQCGAVVFSGCCWGALTVRTRASVYRTGDPVQVVTPEQSIALSFLAAGASAFVGCTGAHYSPIEGDLNYFGAPMHSAFWKHIAAGRKPAEALFQAKIDYIKGMPHGRSKIEEVAIENKILRQFTCLGLGW
ncbi:hypothetical protein S58_10190 [Bradyrhizobium oligotrophicum S58]|uniref:Metallo-beta-lactamase domain-containing protein n=1 Tax=Bradyrhizobium oligotrophicum S58 TaxID=1245469 RepID=M4ZLB2_9BRAD|nr:MBL fold metallo-hydrolase [Bradyrhizobium oligotrophicum]BAM87030.1 hypothetical protein S58_10190 [Bradyrhizobium oligotrophicum S58]